MVFCGRRAMTTHLELSYSNAIETLVSAGYEAARLTAIPEVSNPARLKGA